MKATASAGFIGYNRNRIGEVEGTCFLLHGDPVTFILIFSKNLIWKPRGFAPEDQKDKAEKVSQIIRIRGLFCNENVVPAWIGTQKLIKTVVKNDLDHVPVIQSSTLKMLIVHGKTQWSDQVKAGTQGRTSPYDIPRIVGDLGLIQHHIEFFHVRFPVTL